MGYNKINEIRYRLKMPVTDFLYLSYYLLYSFFDKIILKKKMVKKVLMESVCKKYVQA